MLVRLHIYVVGARLGPGGASIRGTGGVSKYHPVVVISCQLPHVTGVNITPLKVTEIW
jgi:hypothetical protein